MSPSILILGATGTVGGEVVRLLAASPARVLAATRRPGDVAARFGGAVEPRELDLERPATFAPALRGVDRVFLIARPGDDHPDALAGPLVGAMVAAGVTRVVTLTAMGVGEHDDAPLRAMERQVEAAGLGWTHLRPNFFFQVLLGGALAAGARRGVLALPAGDARVSYVDALDVAAVAAAALVDDAHVGRAYTLTGGAALHHDEVARAIGAATGHPVRYVALDEASARDALASAGFSPARVERLIGFYRLVRAGMTAPVSPDVPAILGRAPRTLVGFVDAHRAAWQPGGGQQPQPE